jgi:hypothetical protein
LIRQALKEEPDNPTFLNTLGVVQCRNGQYQEAFLLLFFFSETCNDLLAWRPAIAHAAANRVTA